MSRRLLLRAAATLVALSSADTLPQPVPATPAGPPLYQVEVLIFAYRDFDTSEERFAQGAPPRHPDEARRPVPVFDESTLEPLEPPSPGAPGDAPPTLGAVEPAPGAADPLGFRILRPEELQLSAEYRKLERVPTYLPLGHGGWVQPGLPEDQSQPFDLAQLGVLNPAGSVRVYLSRFLHVTVDVSYRDTLHGAPAAAPARGALAEVDIAPRYDLVAERQTRSGELQYFDHPAFGVLVKVTPVPGPARGTRPAA